MLQKPVSQTVATIVGCVCSVISVSLLPDASMMGQNEQDVAK